MSYTIEFAKSSVKELKTIPITDQNRVVAEIQNLADNPRPSGCKKLKGSGFYRIRVGNYRVIYDIQDSLLKILILKIGDRKDIYD